MSKRFGFTLAEVLITLGIIGVVAAMTIPTLIQNYNTRVWNTGAKVFERKLEEALKTMNTQQTLAGHTTTESFVEELSKHFKTNKICQNDELLDCFEDTVWWGSGDDGPAEVDMNLVKTSKNFGQKDWQTNVVGVQFANGVTALIAYNPTIGDKACKQDPYSNQIDGKDCLAILYDTSGEKNPNQGGKDLRSINVTKLGQYCALELNGTCFAQAIGITTPHVWNDCYDYYGTTSDAEDIAFMEKYGITGCKNNDYWAKAVETCGGKDKMPTASQLQQLADYFHDQLYDGKGHEASLALGLIPYHNSGSYYIWSGEEDSNVTVKSHYFRTGEGLSHSAQSGMYKSYAYDPGLNTYVYTVCLE